MTPTVTIPTLETERLTLRAPQMADYPAFEAMMMSERSRMMGGPFDRQGAWGGFCHAIGTWSLFGQGSLFLEHKESGEVIGEVGLNNGPLFPETELGWSLFEGHEGQGFATEAARAMQHWAFTEAGLQTLVSYTHPDNLRSQAVARRLGGVEDLTAARQDPEDFVFRYQRPAL